MARHMLSWMDDHLDHEMVKAVIAFHANADDAVRAFSTWGLDLAGKDEDGVRETVQHRLSDLLEGHDEDTSRAMLGRFAASGREIDATMLTMLRQSGMDVAAMLDIAHTIGSWSDKHRTTRFVISKGSARGMKVEIQFDGVHADVRMPMAKDVFWTSTGVILFERPLPNAVMIAMQDKPLAKVISHPVLDALGLHIKDVTVPLGMKTVNIVTDYAPSALRREEITFDNTRPDRSGPVAERPSPVRASNEPTF